MNMMRSDLESLGLDAKMIDSSKVIDGYIYLSEELVEEKKRKKQLRRTNILFSFLLASVGLLAWDQYRFMQQPDVINLEAFHAAPALGDLLADNVVEHLQPETAVSVGVDDLEMGVAVPDDIVKFIDAHVMVDDVVQKSGIVLEEVKTPVKAKINIDRVLASADRLFKRDRLMYPPVHNAFARYEKVLSVHPDHPEALAGIKKIVDRYVYLAEKVIKKKEAYKVPELITRAYQAGEKYMDVSIIISRFSDYLVDDSVFVDHVTTAKASDQSSDVYKAVSP